MACTPSNPHFVQTLKLTTRDCPGSESFFFVRYQNCFQPQRILEAFPYWFYSVKLTGVWASEVSRPDGCNRSEHPMTETPDLQGTGNVIGNMRLIARVLKLLYIGVNKMFPSTETFLRGQSDRTRNNHIQRDCRPYERPITEISPRAFRGKRPGEEWLIILANTPVSQGSNNVPK